MRAIVASLLELPPGGDLCDAGGAPDLHEILAEDCGCPPQSRMPSCLLSAACIGTAVDVRKGAPENAAVLCKLGEQYFWRATVLSYRLLRCMLAPGQNVSVNLTV